MAIGAFTGNQLSENYVEAKIISRGNRAPAVEVDVAGDAVFAFNGLAADVIVLHISEAKQLAADGMVKLTP